MKRVSGQSFRDFTTSRIEPLGMLLLEVHGTRFDAAVVAPDGSRLTPPPDTFIESEEIEKALAGARSDA